MDVERGNQIVDPILEDGIRVLRDVFDIPIQNYGRNETGVTTIRARASPNYLITTTSSIIDAILEEYHVTLDVLKRFLKRLDVPGNLICKLAKHSETDELISKNGRIFFKHHRASHVEQLGTRVADLTVFHFGYVTDKERKIRVTILMVDGILMQDDQNLRELLLLHNQPEPNENASLMHLDALPYGIIVDMVRKGSVDPLHLCGTTRRLREYCERSFRYENTQREVRQYIYYVALQRVDVNVDLITLRTGLSNKDIYIRYIKIKNIYAVFIRKVSKSIRSSDPNTIFYSDITGLLYFDVRLFVRPTFRFITEPFMYYKFSTDPRAKQLEPYGIILKELNRIALKNNLTTLPRNPRLYAEILGISTEELYIECNENILFKRQKITYDFFMEYHRHLAGYLRRYSASREIEFERLKNFRSSLDLNDGEIYMLVDLHIAVINGTIDAIDPFDINTVIMSIP